jgi:hypothetical protein
MLFTAYGRQLIAGSVFGQLMQVPSNFYVALMYSAPSGSSTGSDLDEPLSSEGYSRLSIPNNSVSFEFDGLNAVKLSSDFYFEASTSDWKSIEYWGICDQRTEGNLIAYEDLVARFTVNAGDQAVLPAGNLKFLINPEGS